MFDCFRVGTALQLVIALSAGLPAGMSGQVDAPPQDDGSQIEVLLVTMGAGARFWERFGHNAIWIRDPARGIDTLYNYGIFDFEAENFVLNFIQGRMEYRLASQQPRASLSWYRRLDRSLSVQELNLTPRQRIELRDYLLWNDRPENRYYRYDYYKDNCSTRVRDALDRVLDGQIRSQTESLSNGTTFRFHTQRLTAIDPLYYTSLLLITGNPVDRPISYWEEMFIPMRMATYLRDVTVIDDAGNEVPLVASERVLYTSHLAPPPLEPPAWLLGYLAVGILVGAVILGLGAGATRRRVFRLLLAATSSGLALVVGLGGVVIVHLWAFTDHAVASWNENVLQVTPLALPMVVLAPALVYGKPWAVRYGMGLAGLIAGLSLLGWVGQVLPGLDQVNGPVIALMLPVHLGLGIALWLVSQGKTGAAPPDPTPR